MKILVLGADGYLGWPTCLYFASKKFKVFGVDNFSKRQIEVANNIRPLNEIETFQKRLDIWNKINKNKIKFFAGDLLNHRFIYNIIKKVKPDAIIHYAEQPSAPYSMGDREKAVFTQHNNIIGNLNLMFAVKKYVPNSHIVKLGTMGVYGTPNIDIEEGYLNIKHKGRSEKILFPTRPHSFYHLSKAADSLNLAFACRVWNMRVTDLNQGVVYGANTDQTLINKSFTTSFHYDHIFGTVINRFIVQAAIGFPLSVYGAGKQRRTFLNINDTLKCVELAIKHPADKGEFRVRNQFTEVFSILELAKKVEKVGIKMGLNTKIKFLKNPRHEMKQHYYKPTNKSFLKIGLKPTFLNDKFISEQINLAILSKNKINKKIIDPKIKWDQKK